MLLWSESTSLSGVFKSIFIPVNLLSKTSVSYPQLEYSDVPSIQGKVLEVTVKSKKAFVAATNVKLVEQWLDKDQWFPLGNCPN